MAHRPGILQEVMTDRLESERLELAFLEYVVEATRAVLKRLAIRRAFIRSLKRHLVIVGKRCSRLWREMIGVEWPHVGFKRVAFLRSESRKIFWTTFIATQPIPKPIGKIGQLSKLCHGDASEYQPRAVQRFDGAL
jgi:hypothetical protein